MNKDIKYYFQRYLNEITEASVLIVIIKLSTNNPIDIKEVLLYSIIIGIITLILEEYNQSIYNRVKTGMQTSIGAVLMRTIIA